MKLVVPIAVGVVGAGIGMFASRLSLWSAAGIVGGSFMLLFVFGMAFGYMITIQESHRERALSALSDFRDAIRRLSARQNVSLADVAVAMAEAVTNRVIGRLVPELLGHQNEKRIDAAFGMAQKVASEEVTALKNAVELESEEEI